VVDADVLVRRILSLNDALANLGRAGASSEASLLADPMLRAAVERWLQIAIEACIDMAYHAVAARGWTPPDGARSAFLSLAAHGLLDEALARRLGAASGMRNLLVHNYADVDLGRMAHVVAHDLDDLRRFAAIISQLLIGE